MLVFRHGVVFPEARGHTKSRHYISNLEASCQLFISYNIYALKTVVSTQIHRLIDRFHYGLGQDRIKKFQGSGLVNPASNCKHVKLNQRLER